MAPTEISVCSVYSVVDILAIIGPKVASRRLNPA